MRQRWRRPRPRATPTILQMEATECGAASLAMVLAHHGRWVPSEEMRLACGVTRDGSKASNILKAARHYGLQGKGFRKEPEGLEALPLPAIIHWNFNHFVVLEGFRGKWAHLNDPAAGRRRVSREELSENFTGVVLAFEKAEAFRRHGGPQRALPELWRQLAGSRRGLALVVMLSLLLVLPGIVVPAFSKLFVDDVLVAGSGSWLSPLLLGMALTAGLRLAILLLRQHYLLRLEVKLGLTMASRFMWHVLHLPVAFFSQRHAGDIASRIAIGQDVARLLSGDLAVTVLQLVSVSFYAAVMLAYDAPLTALALPIVALNFAVATLAGRRQEDEAGRLAQDRGQLVGATVGTIRAIETIKANGVEQAAFERWAGYHAKAANAAQALGRQGAMIGVAPPLLATLGNAVVLGLGGLRVMHGAMSVGELVAFQTLLASVADPVGRLAGFAVQLRQVRADLGRMRDVLAHAPGRADAPEGAAPLRLAGAVELRSVTFGYNPNESPLVENFGLVVHPGQRVAIVGGSGSGKSTLGRLICGLHQPWSGEILFDGISLADLPRATLAHSLAYVDQDVILFAGTVRENVSLWDDSIEDAAIARALQDAEIFDEIGIRPGIYDYRIAEGGRDFSGGQRQRLEIARALATDPAILVLDEATSALDPLVEQRIDRNIRRRGCTTIVIAHRFSTIRDADQIVVLAGGRVVGHGTHDELIERCPSYAELLRTEPAA